MWAIQSGAANVRRELPAASMPTFIFRDEFITNEVAPIVTPRTAEPGPGAWTVIQNDGQMSIVASELTVPAQVSAVSGDLAMYSNANIPRATGLALIILIRFSTLNSFGVMFGSATAFNELNHTWAWSAFGHEIYGAGLLQRVGATYALNTDIILTMVLRAIGAYFIKDEELVGVDYSGNLANVRSKLTNMSAVLKEDYVRVAQLAAIFAPDILPIYTDATPTVDDTATAHQDAVHYIIWTPVAAEVFEIRFRWVDDNNCVILRCDQTGSTAKIIRKIAGVETEMFSVARVWTIGTPFRIGLRYINNKIHAHVVNVASLVNDLTVGYNSEVAGAKIAGFATATNWEIYPSIMSDATMNEITRYSNPFLSGSGRLPQTISLADGGDITAAIATMRAGDTLSLATNGNYTLAGGVTGFSALPSGFWGKKTTVLGNGATVIGGLISMGFTGKKHIQVDNIRLIDATSRGLFVAASRWLTFTRIYGSSNVNSTFLDVFRFENSRDITMTDCEAAPSTGWAEIDGFECTDQSGNITFTNCIAHGVVHGFEAWSNTLASNVWKNYYVTWLNCQSYDNLVGYSSEGGPQALAQIEIVANGCTASSNSEFDYQGIDGSTLYLENNTGGTTNGNVTIRS